MNVCLSLFQINTTEPWLGPTLCILIRFFIFAFKALFSDLSTDIRLIFPHNVTSALKEVLLYRFRESASPKKK